MLEIIKKQGADGYEDVLNALGLSPDSVSISEAVNGDTVGGYCIYKLAPELVSIYKISDGGDLVLADGILRSVLFLGALKGIERAEFLFGSEETPKRLKLISDGNILEPISGIFGGCESCKNK